MKYNRKVVAPPNRTPPRYAPMLGRSIIGSDFLKFIVNAALNNNAFITAPISSCGCPRNNGIV